ncbi:IS3 family transposase [Kytococcus sedentarius]|uniref:IS3 family transposase n=1 Tax=Kytococcus sedentarius TaxID=1276 RepID=UPI0038516F9F
MIRFIDEHRDQFGVEAICRTLGATECGFITSRGYRAAKTRPPSARALRDVLLLEEVKQIHADNYSVYGVRKMHHAMRRAGWEVGRDQVARLMRAAGLQGVRRGRRPLTTRPTGQPDHRPDLVERRFVADRPRQLWVADITYVRTITGFCYVAFITDVYSRKIVGWAVSSSLHTAGLPLLALEHALLSTGASRGHKGLVHHSDRGVQGGFNWSSQHLDQEVSDGSSSTGSRQGGSSEAPFAGASEVPEARRGGVLGRDRERTARGGSRGRLRRGARGRREMVPTRWRHGAVRHHSAAIGSLPLVR